MRSVLKITIVLLCGAAGTAAAVWLAGNTSPDSVPDLSRLLSSTTTAASPAETPATNTNHAAAAHEDHARPEFKVSIGPEHFGHGEDKDKSALGSLSSPLPPVVLNGAPAVAQQVAAPEHTTAPRSKRRPPSEPKQEAQMPVSDVLAVLRDVVRDRDRDRQRDRESVPLRLAAAPLVPPNPAPLNAPTSSDVAAQTQGPVPVAPPNPGARPSAPASQGNAPQVTSNGDNKFSLHLVDSDVREVLQLLSRSSGVAILPSDGVTGTINASLPNVDFETALNAILRAKGYVARREGNVIYVGTSDEFKKRELASGKIATKIFRPNYISAAELQKLVTPLLSPQVGTITVTSPPQVGIGSDSAVAGGDNYANSDVLLIRDYETVLKQIDDVVHDVDLRPLQVAIEAMILSVKLNDQMDMGVDFAALKDNNHVRIVSGTPAASLNALSAPDSGQGLKVGFLDSNLSVFVKALETVGDTNVIATPRILALNKMRAEILIGSQLGYVSTTVTETSTTQAVQFLEVGTQLRLRPFISSDGMIRMEVHPELSTGTVHTENGFTLPDKELTGVTTNIMARDGSTVIIGGLIREDLDTTMSQIPLIGSLPAVGALFRQKTEKTDRREIIVLITPRIVCDADMNREGNQGAMEFHHRQAIYGEKMSPFSRVHLCKKYIYLAQQAWGEGKQERALRLVNLAIQFDPENRSAIDLRSDIAAGIPVGNHTGQAPFIPPGEPGADIHSSGAEEVAPWVLDELDPAKGKLPPPHANQGASNSHVGSGAVGVR